MGKYFSDVVEQAIEDIYYCYDKNRAARALGPLTEAAEAGDGDASYILSRCHSGPQYSWKYHPFQANDDKAEEYVRKSILQGSAIGVLGSMRCGMFTPEMQEKMPFGSLKEAWNIVYEKARGGSLFCQNMIGNTYFWLDIVEIEGKRMEDFPSKEAFGAYLRESTIACIPWFLMAFKGGMGFAGKNIYHLYQSGEEGLIEPVPAQATEVARLGAELGYPDWEKIYGAELLKQEGRETEGLRYCESAAGKGELTAWYQVGDAYRTGKVVRKDVPYAMSCYEKGLPDPENVGCYNRAGELLFQGKDGIAQDYVRAVQLLEHACSQGSKYGNDMLGVCYLFGYGCQKDPALAKKMFDEAGYTSDLLNYGRGMMYAEGMGVPEDIKKGVEYLQKAKDYVPAREAMLNYKKTLFGKWVRR